MKALIVSTSLGQGHEGSARELTRRLGGSSHEGLTVDYLTLLPPGVGRLVRSYYRAQLRYFPASYQRSYEFFPHIHRQFAAVNALFARRRVVDLVKRYKPDVIVSNNPHATMALGDLKRRHHVDVPVVTIVTDVGVHRLWVHQDISANLVVHECSAAEAIEHGAQSVSVIGPLVAPAFHSSPDGKTRPEVGDGRVFKVLVTAGSWGVGDLEETLTDLLQVEGVQPTVICGNDKRLLRRLESLTGCVALGWVEDMATLLSGMDLVVENAGGLTCMEALTLGVPVVSYRPIAGHGIHNAQAMSDAGLTTFAADLPSLVAIIKGLRTASAPSSEIFGSVKDVVTVLEGVALSNG